MADTTTSDYAIRLARLLIQAADSLAKEVQPADSGDTMTEGYLSTLSHLFGLVDAASLLSCREGYRRTRQEVLARVNDAKFEPEDYRAEYVAKYIEPWPADPFDGLAERLRPKS